MVDGWIEDVLVQHNKLADLLIQNTHRWICCSNSKIYDHVIARVLRKIMQKFLGYLVAKLKEMRATIIYASTNKIIICTNKYNKSAAKNYTEFILKTLVSYPLFQYLIIKPEKYWKVLLFKDIFNYSGIPEEQSDNANIAYEWNIAKVLPPKIEEYFLALVFEYIILYYKQIQKNSEILEKQIHQEKNKDMMTKLKVDFIRNTLSSKLYSYIPMIEKKFRNDR